MAKEGTFIVISEVSSDNFEINLSEQHTERDEEAMNQYIRFLSSIELNSGSIETLIKYVTNIINRPGDLTTRSIRFSSKLFRRDILSCEHALKFLKILGFIEIDRTLTSETSTDPLLNKFLELPLEKENHQLLVYAQNFLYEKSLSLTSQNNQSEHFNQLQLEPQQLIDNYSERPVDDYQEEQLHYDFRHDKPIYFQEEQQTDYSEQPFHNQETQQVDYSQQQPFYNFQQGQHMYYPGQAQPMYYPGPVHPMYYPGQAQPMYYSGQTQSMYYPQQEQPMYYPQQGQPMYYPQQGQPMYYPGQVQPMYYNQGQPIYYPPQEQPTYYTEQGQVVDYTEKGEINEDTEEGQEPKFDPFKPLSFKTTTVDVFQVPSQSQSKIQQTLEELRAKHDSIPMEIPDRCLQVFSSDESFPDNESKYIQNKVAVDHHTSIEDDTVASIECDLLKLSIERKMLQKESFEKTAFQTKSMREIERLKKKKIYSSSLIRIHFPDHIIIQAKFHPNETIQDIINFLYDCFNGSPTFRLYTTPPVTYLLPKMVIKEQGFIPAAMIHLIWEMENEHIPNFRDYLRSELQEKKCSELISISYPIGRSLKDDRTQDDQKENLSHIIPPLPLQLEVPPVPPIPAQPEIPTQVETSVDSQFNPSTVPQVETLSTQNPSSTKKPSWLKL